MRNLTKFGFTIVEVLVVLSIVAVLMAILVPTFRLARRRADIQVSSGKLHQMWMALETYRQDWDGNDGDYGSFYGLGLPNDEAYFSTLLGLPHDYWLSPCGYDETLFRSGLNQIPGFITYLGTFMQPDVLIDVRSNPPFHGYLEEYKGNSAMFIDCYCNEHGLSMSAPLVRKRALSVLLSGKLVDRMRTGDGAVPQFYSDPPE